LELAVVLLDGYCHYWQGRGAAIKELPTMTTYVSCRWLAFPLTN
jgi:hypothetical protein